MGKNIGKNISKNLSSKYDQKLLDQAKQSVTDAFKTAPKRAIQTRAEATGHWSVIKLLIKLQINHPEIFQKQLKVKQKYQKRDIYLQKKGRKLLIN